MTDSPKDRAEELLRLAGGIRRAPEPYRGGDRVYLGEGIWWTIDCRLAEKLNRFRARAGQS